MKILQLCAAGISAPALTKEFEKLGHEVLKADCDPPSKDFIELPKGKDEDFLSEIEKITGEIKDFVILPHNQDEVKALSLAGGRGKGWKALVPSPVSFFNTVNKPTLHLIAAKAGLSRPDFMGVCSKEDIFSDLKISAFYKPVEGCGGKFVFSSEDIPDEFFFSKIHSGKEYTIDCLCLEGEVFDFCIRERIKSHGGICIDARVHGQKIKSEGGLEVDIKEDLIKFAKVFHLNGPYAIQGFLEGPVFCFTDCNHRFGGGVGLSILAGWKGVENYCRILSNDILIPPKKIRKIRVRRYYREEII